MSKTAQDAQLVPPSAVSGGGWDADLLYLAEMLEGVPMPAFALDRGDWVVAANVPALAVLGEGARGRHLALSLRAPEVLDAVAALRATGGAAEVTFRLGAQAHYRLRLSKLAHGPEPRVLCVLEDVTSAALNETMRREFVANVSHELRTPLTAMIGFIETLQTTAKDDARARTRFLEIMANEAGRMNRLVRDLLHLSRVEAEERVRPRVVLDLYTIVQTVAGSVRALAGEHQVELVFEGAEPGLMVPGDADQLTQVVLNLLENAIKYGGRARKVVVRFSREPSSRGPVIRLAVIDQGEGIDAVHLPRLTERFYRVDRHRSRAEGGTGLGLAIVKHIVNRHRGWLKIESEKGKGSTFSVLLPEG